MFCKVLLVTILLLSSCANNQIGNDNTNYPVNSYDLHSQEVGSLLNKNEGFTIFENGKGSNTPTESKTLVSNKINVNPVLWRASIDTISFMPIISVDPIGGIIITDWYSSPNTPNERIKLNILVLNGEFKATSLKVTTFKQVLNKGSWKDIAVNPEVSKDVEQTILNKAKAN